MVNGGAGARRAGGRARGHGALAYLGRCAGAGLVGSLLGLIVKCSEAPVAALIAVLVEASSSTPRLNGREPDAR